MNIQDVNANEIMKCVIVDGDEFPNPNAGALFYYLQQETDTPFKEWTNALKHFFKESNTDPADFVKKHNYDFKNLWNDVYVPFAIDGGSCNSDTYEYQIEMSTPFMELCDYLGIKVETVESPASWWANNKPDIHFAEDMKDSIRNCSTEDCRNFARFFSEKPENWFPRQDDWLDKFVDSVQV